MTHLLGDPSRRHSTHCPQPSLYLPLSLSPYLSHTHTDTVLKAPHETPTAIAANYTRAFPPLTSRSFPP